MTYLLRQFDKLSLWSLPLEATLFSRRVLTWRNKYVMGGVLVLLFMSTCVFSQTNTFELLTDVGADASMIARGNIDGFSDNASSVLENPAGLTRVGRASFSGFYTSFNDGWTNFYAYAAAYRLPKGVLGLGMMQTSVPDIHDTGADSGDVFFSKGTFDYSNVVYKVAYALPLTRLLRLGIGANYVRQDFQDVHGSGANADLGLLWGNDQHELSISARHFLGLPIKYSGLGEEHPPSHYTIGTRVEIIAPGFYLYDQIRFLTTKDQHLLSFGATYASPALDNLLTLSAGWQEVLIIREKDQKWTLGLTLDLGDVALGFAYEEAQYVGQNGQYYFSINYSVD